MRRSNRQTRHNRPSRAAADPRSHAPLLDRLEPRVVLSASLNGLGELRVVGSTQGDVIVISPGPQKGQVALTGVPDVADGTVFSGVQSIDVNLGNGDDALTLSATLPRADDATIPLRVNCGNGNDTVTLQNDDGATDIRGNNGADSLTGGDADDRLFGGRGADTLVGGDGDDRLVGKIGADILIGGNGDDALIGNQANDELWGNAGDDLLRGGGQRDLLAGGLGDDRLFGGLHRDALLGDPSEARDFNVRDVNFDAAFAANTPGVLLGKTFWDRLAAGEESNAGRLDGAALQVTSDLAYAFARSTQAFRMVVQTASELPRNTANQVRDALLAVTNAFSPPIAADPTLLTLQSLTQLRDDLNAAVPNVNPFRQAYLAFTASLFADLISGEHWGEVNQLTPGAASTQGVLFGADSVYNLTDILN